MACQVILDDIRAMAREVANGLVDLDIEFSKTTSENKSVQTYEIAL
jgi:hypothetical protein